MIKKIISVAFVAAVLSIGVYSYTQSKNGKSMDNLSLANVEALAEGEDNTSTYQEVPCSTGQNTGSQCIRRYSTGPSCTRPSYC